MEGGDVETDDVLVIRRAICEWYRAAPEDRSEATAGIQSDSDPK